MVNNDGANVGKELIDVLNNDNVNSSVNVDEQLVSESDDNDDVNSSVGVKKHVNGVDGAVEEQLVVTDIEVNSNPLYYRQRSSSVNVECVENVLVPNFLDDEVTRDTFIIDRTIVVKPINKIKPGCTDKCIRNCHSRFS